MARTRLGLGPIIPRPRPDQLVPFQRAILFRWFPPTPVKSPPAYSAPSDTWNARTTPIGRFIPFCRPEFNAEHSGAPCPEGPHRAMPATDAVPALVKLPPTSNSPLLTIASYTPAVSPSASGSHVPLGDDHRAARFALTPPIVLKSPTAYRCIPSLRMRRTSSSAPLNGSQADPFQTAMCWTAKPPELRKRP